MAFAVRSTSSISMAKSFAKSSNARLSVVSRASEQEPATPAPSTSESAPQKVVSTSAPEEVVSTSGYTKPTPPPAPFAATLGDVMNFGGAAPEITNGRLAMVGFVAALGAELSSGESVLRQIGDEPTLINITFLLFIAASLIPMFQNKKAEAFGPFTPNAELLNGRAAMIGFAALLAFEATNGAAMF
eukprot:gene29433-biopygen5357